MRLDEHESVTVSEVADAVWHKDSSNLIEKASGIGNVLVQVIAYDEIK